MVYDNDNEKEPLLVREKISRFGQVNFFCNQLLTQ